MKIIEWNVKQYESIVVEFDNVDMVDSYRVDMRQKGFTEKDLGNVYGKNCWLFAKLTACDLINGGTLDEC